MTNRPTPKQVEAKGDEPMKQGIAAYFRSEWLKAEKRIRRVRRIAQEARGTQCLIAPDEIFDALKEDL